MDNVLKMVKQMTQKPDVKSQLFIAEVVAEKPMTLKMGDNQYSAKGFTIYQIVMPGLDLNLALKFTGEGSLKHNPKDNKMKIKKGDLVVVADLSSALVVLGKVEKL